MKTWSLAAVLATNAFFASYCLADDAQKTQTASKIPTEEKAFVDAVGQLDKTKIVAQLGQPAKADDVRIKDTDKIAASIWQYHNLNTAADGTLYLTTELDFIDDKVVQIVFLNNDGSEGSEGGETYELPAAKPGLE